MRIGVRLFALALLLGAFLASGAEARTITDSAGRVVGLPDRVETAFAAGPPAAILLYILAPETMAGWPRSLRPNEKPYVAAPYRDLPQTGRITGRGGEANLERVLALDPDLIVDFGSVKDTYVDLADRVQAQTGIPYILVDGRFENTAAALRLVGEALGVAARGERLARDVEATFARIDAAVAAVPDADRPHVYLARGPEGLESGGVGSINTEIIERAGGVNVAGRGEGRRNLVRLSMEQVLAADPDTIITWDPNFHATVWTDPLWGEVTAVQRGRVFLSPTLPFGWIDRPPSVNRMMGLAYVGGLFYPEQWKGDLRAETRAFYELYYHVRLDDPTLDQLLAWAKGRPPR